MTKTILIVDDFESSRNILEKTLKNAGYAVLKGEDGNDALKQMNGATIDLVITDLNMPNMDGLTLTKSIRGIRSHQYVPIILLTTSTKSDQQETAKAAGVTMCITKPYDVQNLLSVVKKIVR